MRTPAGHNVYTMAAEYPSAAALYEAAKHVRDAGFKRWDVYSPFPIHGMDQRWGWEILVEWMGFVRGLTGLLTAAVSNLGRHRFSIGSTCTASRGISLPSRRTSRSCLN